MKNKSLEQLETELKSLETEENRLIDDYRNLLSDRGVVIWQRSRKAWTFIQQYLKPQRVIRYLVKNWNRSLVEHARRLKLIFTSHTHFDNQFHDYQDWVAKHYPSESILTKQRSLSKRFVTKPLISIILPTYNTPAKFLNECIESVIKQSYGNWELCIADDKSNDKTTIEIIKKYSAQYSNIKSKFRKTNGHICEASNSALSLAEGEYVALLDHDDILWPNALFEIVKAINANPQVEFLYSDEDKLMDDGERHTEPFFKPDWSPDYLRSINYITHFSVLKKSLVESVGSFRNGYEGAQDWDLFLRATRHLDASSKKPNHPYLEDNKIIHIPKVLYSWRISNNSTASAEYAATTKDYAYKNQKLVLEEDLKARKLRGRVAETEYLGLWNIQYEIVNRPKVSIIIPTKNQYGYISKCLKSIFDKTSYDNYDVVAVDTGSDDRNIHKLYTEYEQNDRFKLLHWKKEFNFSAVCNFGSSQSDAEYFLFLNNDTEVLTEDWIERMLGLAQQDHIGAVGAKLLYPDRKIQHLGGLLGITGDPNEIGIAGHVYRGQEEFFRNFDRLAIKNYSFVTGACMMINKNKFNETNGFDEAFQIAFNDIDFCLRLNKKGYFHVVEPYAELLHMESASLKSPGEEGRDMIQWKKEVSLFLDRWDEVRENDPFMNINLSRNSENLQTL